MHLPFTHFLATRLGPLEFGDPMWLLAFLSLIPIFYFWKTSRVPASKLRRWVSLLLRVSLVAAIILSLADTRMVWFNKGICVAFVVDQSQSVPGDARSRVRDLIKAEVDKMTKDDQFVIVEFGGDSVLEALPSPRGDIPAPAKVADTSHTNVARALRLAMATFPADRQKRVVLFSDGNQNQEDALREARIAGVKEVDIDVVPILARQGHEVIVDQLIVPPHVRKDARFLVRALVTSDTAQDVEVLISRDGNPLTRLDNQHLKPGSNVIDVPDLLSDGGAHQYQLTVIPKNSENDTFAANNTGYGLTSVDAPGRILLVPGKTADSTYLYNALRSAGVDVVKAPVAGLPASTDELAGFDCVILDNVNYADVNTAPQMSALKHWVEDYGGGLVMVGGDDSFGPGGYTGTVLEDLSPVNMDIKRQKHLASLAVVVILDKSGSMGMTIDATHEKMDLANEGACEVVKLLDAQDLAMLGACDTAVRWVDDGPRVIAMTPGNKNRLTTGIRSVRAGGGGIDCNTALTHSYDMVRTADTMSKHVVMFGDAQDCDQQNGCVEMARDMYLKFGITTSVMGMGKETDVHAKFEHDVANAGHGRCFITEDVNNLPRLFMKDAFLVSRQAFIEDKNGIKLTPYNSPLLQGFLANGKASLPSLYGYIGTTLKPRATLALHGKQADDPVLAHWVIGLGKCVAFTSDSSARWSKDFVSWDGYSKFWSQIVRWVARSSQANGLTTTTLIEGSDGRVVVDAASSDGKPINNLQLQASIVTPDQAASASNKVTLEQIAPGRYQGRFAANQRGTYLVAVSEGTEGNQQLVDRSGGVAYTQEFRDLQPNIALLKTLAEASNGAYLNDINGIFQQKPNAVHTFWPLWQLLLLVVTSALFADIAWRRLNVADWFRPRHLGPAVQHTDATVGALRSVKSGRRDVDTQRTTLRERIVAATDSSVTVAPGTPVTTPAPSPAGAFPVNTDPTPAVPPPQPTPASGENYANRLMNAKKRAKEQIRDQEHQ